MRRHGRISGRLLSRVQEALLSSTLALALVTTLIFSSVYWSGQFGGWSMGLNLSFHRALQADFGVNLALLIWSIVFTAVVFIALRLSSMITSLEGSVEKLGGTIAIVAPAVCFLLVRHGQPAYFLYAEPRIKWLLLEDCFAVVCVLLFLYDRWPISVWTTLVLLVLHSAFWYRLYADTLGGGRLCILGVPIMACVSVLTWGYCIQQTRSTE